MTGTRLSDLPRAILLRVKHGDWRGLYTRPTRMGPDRFTDNSRAVLKRAEEEVRSRGNEMLGTQHLLLGLLHAGGAEIDNAFARAGASRGRLVEAIDQRVMLGDVVWDPPKPVELGETPPRPRFVGMTRRAIDAEERAFKLVEQRRLNEVTPSVLLAALLVDRRATATRLLQQTGVNVKALKRAVLEPA